MNQKIQKKESIFVKILEKDDELKIIEEFNKFSFVDYIFPLHTILSTNEKIEELTFSDKSINYYSTYQFYFRKRRQMLHCFNKKFDKYLNDVDRRNIRRIESIYSVNYLCCYILAFYFLFKRPIKFRALNYYLFFYICFVGKVTGYFLTRNSLEEIKFKINVVNKKPFTMKMDDLFDNTIIPDWRCYLYYYGFL